MANKRPRRSKPSDYDVSEPGWMEGLPLAVRRDYVRRGQLVRVEVELELGSVEQLQQLLEYRHGEKTLDEVVREAVTWLLAREARSIVELQGIQARRAEAVRRENEAIAHTRAERDVVDQEHVLEQALSIVAGDDA